MINYQLPKSYTGTSTVNWNGYLWPEFSHDDDVYLRLILLSCLQLNGLLQVKIWAYFPTIFKQWFWVGVLNT